MLSHEIRLEMSKGKKKERTIANLVMLNKRMLVLETLEVLKVIKMSLVLVLVLVKKLSCLWY